MAEIGRPGLPSAKQQQVWEMWKASKSVMEILQAVGSPPRSIFSILLPFGEYYQAPPRRRPKALSMGEREELSRGLAAGASLRSIGRRIGRPASTISREVRRNKGPVRYRASDAEDRMRRLGARATEAPAF